MKPSFVDLKDLIVASSLECKADFESLIVSLATITSTGAESENAKTSCDHPSSSTSHPNQPSPTRVAKKVIQHDDCIADTLVLPGISPHRSDSTMASAWSAPQDEHLSSKELANLWRAKSAILLSPAFLMLLVRHMLIKFQTPSHSMLGQMLLRQHEALLQPSAFWRLSFTSSSFKLAHISFVQCALSRSQISFAHIVIYLPYIEQLPNLAKHEKQWLQQPPHSN